jgi:hypothetical protein
MKKLFLRAEFGPLWEPWEEDEIGRKDFLVISKMLQIQGGRQKFLFISYSNSSDCQFEIF